MASPTQPSLLWKAPAMRESSQNWGCGEEGGARRAQEVGGREGARGAWELGVLVLLLLSCLY